MRQTAEAKEKFAQKEREMRLIAKSSKSTFEPKDTAPASPFPAESKASSKPKTKMPRPAWALTEDVAEVSKCRYSCTSAIYVHIHYYYFRLFSPILTALYSRLLPWVYYFLIGCRQAASDEKEMEDEDDLISFAKNLDYDKYIDDLEVQTMMERVKARISQLERETSADEMREIEAEERAVMRMAMEAKVRVDLNII
jgi:hypothetical protein